MKIVGEDGTLDFTAKSGENNVFDGSGNYSITVTATGYTSPYSFEVKPAEPETTAAPETTTTKQQTTTTTTAKTTASSKTDSPKTGAASAAIPAAVLALATASAFAMRKKND